jgi:very-short-patch-repair endonuclease
MPKDSSRIRGTTQEIEQAARRLRQALTPAEVKLWNALRCRQLAGLRFRCQHPVGQFILDFYCPTCKLVVEVDGKIHEQQTEYDQARIDYLQAYGYRILRFSNQQVFTDLEAVLDEIKAVAEARVDVSNYPEISESPSSRGYRI